MAETGSNTGVMKSLFSELRRRRVLRTAALYIAVAWILVQVIDTIFPIFEFNEDYTRYAALALIGGFPVVVVLSWLFDLDFGSITRTKSLDDDVVPSEISVSDDDPSTTLPLTFSDAPERSVAVMPFVNVGNNPENEFFSDGIAEELLNLLSKARDLKVAARTSSFAFRDSNQDVREIALRLGVRHVLEGSVRRESNRVRISVQLIDAQSGYQLWSSSFDRELHDIFAVQDEISSSIVYALRKAIDETMGAQESLRTSAPTENIEAYQLYLRGMYLWQRRGEQAIVAAISALEQATERDPTFVDAISLLAIAKAILHEYNGEDREVGFGEAEQLAQRAMELSPRSSKPYSILGYIALRRWQWQKSEKNFKIALDRSQHDPLVHQWYSNLLNDVGSSDGALSHALRAYHADRLSPQANNILALNFVMLGHNEDARKHVAVAREFGLGSVVPDWVDYFVLLREHQFDLAIDVLQKSLKSQSKDSAWVRPVVNAISDSTHIEEALTALAQALDEGRITLSMATMQHILLGDADNTFALADRQVDDHSLIHLWLFLPEAQTIRQDIRFMQLMERMGIKGYWTANGLPKLAEDLGVGL